MKVFRFRLFILMAGISSAGVVIYSILGMWQPLPAGIAIVGCCIGAWLFTSWFSGWYLTPLLELLELPSEEESDPITVDDPDIQKIPELLLLKDRFNYMASLSKKQSQEFQENVTQTEIALRTKADFVRNLSHILRTPIGTILGLSEALQATELSKEPENKLQTIYHTAYELSQMINNLLLLAEMDYGMIRFDKQWIVLKGFVEQIITNFFTTTKHDSDPLMPEWEGTIPGQIFYDSHYLKQMLLALIQVALKLQQGTSLKFSIRSNDEKDISFTIHDPALQLSPDELAHVFERFPTIVGMENHINHFTGVGLALVQELAELQGGAAQVTSEQGKGTHWGFTLPLDYDVVPEIQVPSESNVDSAKPVIVEEDTPVADMSGVSRLKAPALPDILIVEDDPGYQLTLQVSIPAGQYTTRVAKDGREALEQIDMSPPDLILMDLVMPDMDGYEAMRQLQADPATCNIPVVALTALATGEDHERIMKSGFKTHLSKPVPLKELRRVLEQLLGSSDTSQ